MSRFGNLVRQFQASSQRLESHADYLVLHAEELADDFGVWLSQTESGHTDPLSHPIKVKALGRYVDDEGETVYSEKLSSGELGYKLNFALEFKLADVDVSRVSSVIRLPLTMEVAEEGVKVEVCDNGGKFGYTRSRMPEYLFDCLYEICEKSLKV
ncbi:hypothetical protein QIY50_07200 [Pseudomonas putida]|nr:hypothetical protein QIY50_07200 [Pseudomonas putida]